MAEVGRRIITDAVWQVEVAGGRHHRGPVEALLNASIATPFAAPA